MIGDRRLADALLKSETMTHDDLRKIQDKIKSEKVTLHEYLIKGRVLTSEDIAGAIIHITGLSYLRLDAVDIQEQACEIVPKDFCKANNLIPVSLMDNVLTVATEDMLVPDVHSELRRITQKDIVVAIAEEEAIKSAIERYYEIRKEEGDATLNRLINEISVDELLAEEAELEEDISDEEEEGSEHDSLVVKLVNSIILDAYSRGASDIHIESYRGSSFPTRVRIRIDGVLVDYCTIPNKYVGAAVSRIKIMAQLDIAERRVPQDGKISFRLSSGKKIELRVATMPTAGGQEDTVLRILTRAEPIPFKQLGLVDRNHKGLLDIIKQPYGLFMVVGPTGSGKTTTLHSILRRINDTERKIWTVEDPVEITQYGLRQVQIAPKRGLTFAIALRAFLRCDPDVIMVGEMRDVETASIGIEASLTGHLVLTTLHTNNAPETVIRLVEMGLDPFSFADALLGVLAQRLMRTVCQECKEPYTPSKDEYDELANEFGRESFEQLAQTVPELRHSDSMTLYRANNEGCRSCNGTGYRGRTAIHELLIASDEIKRLITTGSQVSQIRDLAIQQKMTTLKQDGIIKVFKGLSDIHQVRRVCSR